MIDASIQYPVMQQKSQSRVLKTSPSSPIVWRRGILANHAPMMSALDTGVLRFKEVSWRLAWHPAIWSQNVVPEFGPQ